MPDSHVRLHQGDLESSIIAAFDAYMKAIKNREMTDKEIALVIRPISEILFSLER
jgi:hypothetical protein